MAPDGPVSKDCLDPARRLRSKDDLDGTRCDAPFGKPMRPGHRLSPGVVGEGGVPFSDEDYQGRDLFDRFYEEAQVLRVMPSDGPDEGSRAT